MRKSIAAILFLSASPLMAVVNEHVIQGGPLTVSSVTAVNLQGGGTQCLQTDNAGAVTGTGSACGSGSGGSGIVSPGTFTWTNTYGISASTIAVSTITATGNLDLSPTGEVRVMSNTSVRFMDSDNSHFVGLRSPSVVTSTVAFRLPGADGTNGQPLITNGSGSMAFSSWVNVSSITVSTVAVSGQIVLQDGSIITSTSTFGGADEISELSDGDRVDTLEANVTANTSAIANRVVGPAVSTERAIPAYSDTTGKLIQDTECTFNSALDKILCPGGFQGGDGTAQAYTKFPELNANGTNYFVITGAPTQTVDGCIEVLGQPASGESLRGTSTTNDRDIDGSTVTCRVMEWFTPSGVSAASNPLSVSGSTVFLSTNVYTAKMGVSWDGGGSVLTTGTTYWLVIPASGTLRGFTLTGLPSGSITVNVSSSSVFNTGRVSICASACPTLSGSTIQRDTTLSGWSTALAKDGFLYFVINSIATATQANLSLEWVKF